MKGLMICFFLILVLVIVVQQVQVILMSQVVRIIGIVYLVKYLNIFFFLLKMGICMDIVNSEIFVIFISWYLCSLIWEQEGIWCLRFFFWFEEQEIVVYFFGQLCEWFGVSQVSELGVNGILGSRRYQLEVVFLVYLGFFAISVREGVIT